MSYLCSIIDYIMRVHNSLVETCESYLHSESWKAFTASLRYRLISILPFLSKATKNFNLKRLEASIETNILLSDFQNDMRKRQGIVVTHFVFVFEKFFNNMNQTEHNRAVFFDIRKLFDRVRHDRLIEKLFRLYFLGFLVKEIQSFLTGCSFMARVGKEFPETRLIQIGAHQDLHFSSTL